MSLLYAALITPSLAISHWEHERSNYLHLDFPACPIVCTVSFWIQMMELASSLNGKRCPFC